MASDSQGVKGIAARYAAALFELADEQKALDGVETDLKDLRAMLADSAELTALIRSPLVSRADQQKAVLALADQAQFSGLTRNLLGLLAQHRRLFALPALIDKFLAELARRRGELTAEVTSARPLDEAHVAVLTDVLKEKLGAKVSLAIKTDPALIGGVVVKVGSRLIDTSVKTKLERLELAMKAPQHGAAA